MNSSTLNISRQTRPNCSHLVYDNHSDANDDDDEDKSLFNVGFVMWAATWEDCGGLAFVFEHYSLHTFTPMLYILTVVFEAWNDRNRTKLPSTPTQTSFYGPEVWHHQIKSPCWGFPNHSDDIDYMMVILITIRYMDATFLSVLPKLHFLWRTHLPQHQYYLPSFDKFWTWFQCSIKQF